MKLRLVGLSIVALFALSIVASAGAHTFTASKTGTLKGTGGKQTFTTSAGKVVCESLTATGTVEKLTSNTQKSSVTYAGCEAFGSAVKISVAEYEFNANEFVGVIGKAIVITNATGKCSVLVSAGGANTTLKTVTYGGNNKLSIKTNVSGINYTPSGGVCGTAKLETNGKYEGEAAVEVVGGTLSWK
jgi:hypothetical protein